MFKWMLDGRTNMAKYNKKQPYCIYSHASDNPVRLKLISPYQQLIDDPKMKL
jgi:hypothetical protein